MRNLAIAISMALILLAASANAAPMVDLIWTGTDGSGVTGSSSIDAEVGDTITLDVVVDPDAFVAVTAARLQLVWVHPDLVGISATTCPDDAVPGPGCNFGGQFFTQTADPDIIPGNLNSFSVFDFSSPFGTLADMTLGRITFTVAASGTVEADYFPGLDSITDLLGDSWTPAAEATVNVSAVSEPAMTGLLGLGLAGLGLIGRRRP